MKELYGWWKCNFENYYKSYYFGEDNKGRAIEGTSEPGMDGCYSSPMTYNINNNKMIIEDRNSKTSFTFELKENKLILTNESGKQEIYSK